MQEMQKRAEILSNLKLLPGESVVDIQIHEPRIFYDSPSSLEQMMRLTNAPSPDKIGEHGPSVASLALEVSRKTSVEPGTSPLHPENLPSSDTPLHLHLFEVVFGRDSLRAAIELIPSYPELARTTVLRLAELQGTEYNDAREEEPGRIVHEARDKDDPIAMKISSELGWGWPYYGSVDATPEFIRTLTAYCTRSEENTAFLAETYTDKTGSTHNIAYALDIALEWILRRLDSNQEGLLEFHSVLETGIENQVWKDSPDAYHHADGSIANHRQGIASIEVQVTTYDALLDAADLYEKILDNVSKADILRARAQALKETILDVFWTEDKTGYFVLGTDRDDHGNLRQLKVRTSNMGHTLHSRLLEGDDPEIVRKREAVVRHMLSDAVLNVSGIRTLAKDEVRFRPGAYHNGSVWLWDTHHIAKGLRRHGYRSEADTLDICMLNVIEVTKIFPEYVRGDEGPLPSINQSTITLWDDKVQRRNVLEQPPQEVQAWTVAAILAIKKRLGRRGLFSST
jgi:glycogen debranching enzyme